MSVRDLLRNAAGPTGEKRSQAIFERFGVLDNPFPAANQTIGHPRLIGDADRQIKERIDSFMTEERPSQTIVILGTQGVGKTNLLNEYQQAFREIYCGGDQGFFLVRYYPNPEQSFDSVLKKMLEEFHSEALIRKIGERLGKASDADAQAALAIPSTLEMRNVLKSLKAAKPEQLPKRSELAFEWLIGQRALKIHRDELGVLATLSTPESRTKALRDLVSVASRLKLLSGIFLLLDELEKQDDSLSKMPIVRFLASVKALIDAFPTHLFLMLAMTPAALFRYASFLPALDGRLQDRIELNPLSSENEALKLADLYLRSARRRALDKQAGHAETQDRKPGETPPLSADEIAMRFRELRLEMKRAGYGGVTPRRFLDELRKRADVKLREALTGSRGDKAE